MRNNIGSEAGPVSTKGVEADVASERGVVLYLEDDDDSRAAICMVVTGAGYRCIGARSPRAAFEYVASQGADLDILLVDYNLGAELSGTEVAESIARKLGYSLPTVVLTGDPINAELPWLQDSPIWIAKKPICPEKLVAGLEPLVAFRRAMRSFSTRPIVYR